MVKYEVLMSCGHEDTVEFTGDTMSYKEISC